MQINVIILDLDNTIYPVHSIGHSLFDSLFELISSEDQHAEDIDKIKDDLMRRPFQVVAKHYDFGENLIQKATHLLQHLTYNDPMEFYPDYECIRRLRADKYLVTTGFQKLQQSKIDRLGIAADFVEIHIVDPTTSTKTKKDIFSSIMQRHNYHSSEILVVGDDLHSEIKAATELNIKALLYAHDHIANEINGIRSIGSFEELAEYL